MLRVPKVTKEEFEQLDNPTRVALLKIRYGALTEAGLDRGEAALVAAHAEIDLEEAIVLVRRGCPARTALRILL